MKALITSTLILLFFGPASACVVIGTTQSFVVIERKTDVAIPDVVITWKNIEDGAPVRAATTDSTGQARTWIYSGTFMLRITHPGYLPVEKNVDIRPGYKMEIIVELSNSKRARISIREIQRRVAMRQDQKETNASASTETDESFSAFHCSMQHQSRTAMQEISGSNKLLNKVLAYPNPVTGGVLYVESMFDGRKQLLLYTLSGAEVFRGEIVLHQTIDTGRLQPGVYFLKVVDEKNNDVTVKKIVIP